MHTQQIAYKKICIELSKLCSAGWQLPKAQPHPALAKIALAK